MSWPISTLGEVATIVTGSTPKKVDGNYDGLIPFVTPGDLGSVVEVRDSKVKLTEAGANSGRLLPANSVLVCCIGATIGKTGFAVTPVVTNQQINSLIFDQEKVFPKYAYHYCSTLKSFLMNRSSSTTMPIVNKTSFSEIEIPLPPLTEQKRIAAILDKADAIRRKRQQAIKLADEFLRSVFLDMFGDPVTNPKGWEVKPLKELSLKISSGSTPKGGSKVYVDKGITFFRSQNVWKNDIRLDDVAFIDKKTHESLKKSSLKHKDILMTKTGRFNTENSSLGRAALFLGEDDSANVNGHVYLIRLKEKISHEFVVYILTSNEYREHIRKVCVGGIDKRQLNKEHIEDFPIICPPSDLQLEFIEKLCKIQKLKSNSTESINEVVPLFNALSQKAFSGKL